MILGIIKERFAYVMYTLRHYVALNRLAVKHGYLFPLHDIDKIFLYPFLGKRLTHKLHRAVSSHHYRNGNITNKVEAAFDWESARFTKPDKPLDAYDTWKSYYPDVDMKDTLTTLGMYHPKE